jgi:hypothetical protein
MWYTHRKIIEGTLPNYMLLKQELIFHNHNFDFKFPWCKRPTFIVKLGPFYLMDWRIIGFAHLFLYVSS